MTAKPLPYQQKGNLTEGPVSKHLINMTVPMVWGIFAIISFQLVDMYFISLLGTKELAAISFTFPITYMVFSVFIGFAIAMSSNVSRLVGEGKDEDGLNKIRRITSHGLMLVLGFGIFTALIGLTFQEQIFRAMGANDEMMPLIKDYMTIWFAGAVFVTLPMVGNAAIRATGDSVTPAIIMTVVALVNAILDPILIFGLFGFPRLEIEGAAIATIFGNGCAMLAGLYIIIYKKKLVCLKQALHLNLFWESTKKHLFIALPAGITNAIQPLVNAVIVGLISAYGANAVAAFGVVTRVESFAFIILMALSTGMAPVIGQNWGAENYQRVRKTLSLAIGFNVIWSLFVALILALFGKPIAALFSTDPVVIEYAVLFFWLVPFSYAFGNLIMGWASAFNAMGMPQRSLVMIVVKMLLLLLPAVFIGDHFGGITGIFIAMAAVNVVSGVLFHWLSWRSCLYHSKDI